MIYLKASQNILHSKGSVWKECERKVFLLYINAPPEVSLDKNCHNTKTALEWPKECDNDANALTQLPHSLDPNPAWHLDVPVKPRSMRLYIPTHTGSTANVPVPDTTGLSPTAPVHASTCQLSLLHKCNLNNIKRVVLMLWLISVYVRLTT